MSNTDRLLRHVVLFSFVDEATPEEIRSVEEAFAALPGQIDAIHDFEWGTNVSVENAAQGFTHCFLSRSRAPRTVTPTCPTRPQSVRPDAATLPGSGAGDRLLDVDKGLGTVTRDW